MNYARSQTRKATETRESQGEATDAAILKIIRKHPGSSLYEIAKLADASIGLADGSIRRLDERGEIETRQVLRGGRVATEVFAKGAMKMNPSQVTITSEFFPNPSVYHETAYIYALNRSSIGISPEVQKEWASTALFNVRTSARKEAGNILIEIPDKIKSFYLWQNSTIELSVVDELILMNLVTEIPIVRRQPSWRKI